MPRARRVRAQPGVTLGELDRETHVLGLVGARRRRLQDRHRGPHAWRRRRVAGEETRADRRQRHLVRSGHGRRRGPDGQRRRAPGSLLGAARRRRQLRRRHVVRVPAASADARCSAAWSSTRGTQAIDVLKFYRDFTRRRRTSSPHTPRCCRAGWLAGRRLRRVLQRRSRGRRACPRDAARLRLANPRRRSSRCRFR